MKGFDPEFRDLPDFILGITERIWEGRGIDLIRRWYAPDVLVHTGNGPSRGVEGVVAGTLAVLHQIPDRRLLPEDVIWSGDAQAGFLSSHRILSPGTHRGEGPLGPATGAEVTVRAIADCACRAGRIHEEWLVRDMAGLVRQIGREVEDVARALAAAERAAGRGSWAVEAGERLRRDGGFRPPVHHDHPAAALVREVQTALWSGGLDRIARVYHPACSVHLPGARTAHGHERLQRFWFGWLAAFPDARLVIEHSIAREDPGLPVRVATRWWVVATHTGWGAFGRPTGATVLILGITHSELAHGRIREEWVLVDELALRTQIALQAG